MTTLSLKTARAITDGCLEKARAEGLDPLTVVVLDAGGHPVMLVREDESGILRAEIATGKAYGALGFGLGSRALRGKNPQFLAGAIAAAGGRVVPAPGGVLVREKAGGPVLGAVGISGDSGANDEVCAVAGIEAAGLKADPGQE